MRPPDWLRARVEARIEQGLDGLQIAFGDIELVIRAGLRPRLHLRDVVLSEADGRILARLSDAEASLALRPLLRGRVQPKRIALSGLFATLRREAGGTVSLTLEDTAAPVGQAAGLPQLMEGAEQILLRPQLAALVALDVDAVTLRYEDGRSGKVWTLDGGQVRLRRDGDALGIGADFAVLSGRDYASSVEMNYTSRIGDAGAEFGVSVQDIAAPDIAAQSVALHWLKVLRAPISGALRGSVDKAGALGPLSATLHIGAGALQPTETTRPIPFSGARSYFTYDPAAQTLTFDEMSVDSAWGTGRAEGRAYLGGIENGTLTDLVGQFHFAATALNPAGLYREPVRLEGGTADFRLELDPFRLTLGQMHLSDQGSALDLTGTLTTVAEGWRLAVDGHMDSLTPARLLELWPPSVSEKPRTWVAENVLDGTLHDIDLALRLEEGRKPDIYADLDFDGATVRYNRYLPLMTGASGTLSLERQRLVATADRGIVTAGQGGDLDVAGSSFIIPDVSVKPAAPAVIRLRVGGAVTAVMSLLAGPPVRALRDTDLPVDLAQGQARLEGTLSLPLKKGVPFEEIAFHVAGDLNQVESTVLVPGQTVSATALRLEADQSRVEITGTAHIGALPVVLRWRQPIGPDAPKGSRVEGQVELSPTLLDTFRIGLPEGSVSGQGTGRFTLDLAKGSPPALHLTSDLAGVGLAIPTLGWRKRAEETGMLDLSATLSEAARIERLSIEAAGLTATGSVIGAKDGGLDRALLSSVRLGGWLEAGVELIGRGRAAPDVRILTGVVDLRRAPLDSGGEGGGALSARLDRLQISDSLALQDFSGDFTTHDGLRGSFTGKLNGQTPVRGRIEPQGGGSAIYVESDDGGGVFRSAGILNQGHGGSFEMSLFPAEAPALFNGTLRVRNTRVKDAPAIAALLNAVSVVGLLDEMTGQGIQFTEVEAKFRLEPDRLVLHESSATGPSIGLSMDGLYDLERGVLNMRGVISPVYLINAVGSVLTRKGEGMIGFSYTLKGPAAAPSVQVNPLSGLTPGIFREIFRGAQPTMPGEAPAEPDRTPRRAPDLIEGAEGGR
ncbi:DUF3971 domain-containing protein [Antarcticimicrobium luteum]|uniref:DUF3971 domain-containing protein n=1 Tax=Antarcticimicrobium luteum TaxID=2547397 RepID=A0A4R5VC68_9RHOB|nr:DUF3971 domain-containing protein [Antarcticimicrobium luteum]